MFEIKYLSIAWKDIQGIISYIAKELKASKAATDLLNSLEASIEHLKEFPYSCPVYQPVKKMESEYRILPVKNYIVFYIVDEQNEVVEIQRVLYGKMNLLKAIEKTQTKRKL